MKLVDDLAATFELERSDLNVVSVCVIVLTTNQPLIPPSIETQRASSKGLVCGGGLAIHLTEGEIVYANDSEVPSLSLYFNCAANCKRQGALIPVGEDISKFEVDDDIAWVLIVEKEV